MTKLIGGMSAMLIIVNGVCINGDGIGTATAIMLGGFSLVGFTIPAVVGTLENYFGWRVATLVPQLIFSLTSVPLTIYYLCDSRLRPQESRRVRSFWTVLKTKLRWMPWFSARQTESETLIATPYLPLETSIIAASKASVERVPRSAEPLLSPSENNLQGSHHEYSVLSKTSIVESQSWKELADKDVLTKIDIRKLSTEDFECKSVYEDKIFSPLFLTLTMVLVPAHSYSMHVVLDHLLILLHEELGMQFESATLYMSSFHLAGLISKLMIGPVMDRYNKWLLTFGFGIMVTLSSLLVFDLSFHDIELTTNQSKVTLFVLSCKSCRAQYPTFRVELAVLMTNGESLYLAFGCPDCLHK